MDRDVKQKELAELLDMSQEMYSLIESGYKKSMDAKTVCELVEKAKKRSEVAPGVGKSTEIVSVPEVKNV